MAQDYATLAGTDTLTASRTTLNSSTDALRSSFSGTSAPGSPVEGQWWFDTDAAGNDGALSIYESGGWRLVLPDCGADYCGLLPLSGGTMTGAIAMGSQKLTGLAAGTANGDSVRWEQVNARTKHVVVPIGAVSASQNNYLIVSSGVITITRVSVMTSTTTTGSDSSNKWTFTAQDLTSAATLCTANTDTAELTLDVPTSLGTVTGGVLDALDVVELQIVKTGTITALTQFTAIVEYTYES